MELLLIINESPWASSLSGTAWRFAQASIAAGHEVKAVFFRDDGVYHALWGSLSDDGLNAPADAWRDLAELHGVNLLLCSSSCARRFDDTVLAAAAPLFQPGGLVAMWQMAERCDRVVHF